MAVTTITTVCWQDGKLQLNIPETDDIRARRYRAKEVAEKYAHQITPDGVIFNNVIKVVLSPEFVGCSCPDLKNRLLPCKHVFAAASVLGDAAAIAPEPPSAPARPAAAATRQRRTRCQDIEVGKYFLLSDFLFSDTALREGIPNWVDWETEYGANVLDCMRVMCEKFLDPLCEEFNRVSITRGYLGQQVYARVYPGDRDNWIAGALAHGFQETGGADVRVHSWEGEALELAKYLQAHPERYSFDFIRTYPGSSIICCGVGRFKNRRTILEWLPGFRGSITHKP